MLLLPGITVSANEVKAISNSFTSDKDFTNDGLFHILNILSVAIQQITTSDTTDNIIDSLRRIISYHRLTYGIYYSMSLQVLDERNDIWAGLISRIKQSQESLITSRSSYWPGRSMSFYLSQLQELKDKSKLVDFMIDSTSLLAQLNAERKDVLSYRFKAYNSTISIQRGISSVDVTIEREIYLRPQQQLPLSFESVFSPCLAVALSLLSDECKPRGEGAVPASNDGEKDLLNLDLLLDLCTLQAYAVGP